MKKFISFCLAAAMVFSLTACSLKDKEKDDSKNDPDFDISAPESETPNKDEKGGEVKPIVIPTPSPTPTPAITAEPPATPDNTQSQNPESSSSQQPGDAQNQGTETPSSPTPSAPVSSNPTTTKPTITYPSITYTPVVDLKMTVDANGTSLSNADAKNIANVVLKSIKDITGAVKAQVISVKGTDNKNAVATSIYIVEKDGQQFYYETGFDMNLNENEGWKLSKTYNQSGLDLQYYDIAVDNGKVAVTPKAEYGNNG